jgi:heptose I phosphotransferase
LKTFLSETLKKSCAEDEVFDWIHQLADEALPKDIYREKEGRKTFRFSVDQRSFFAKLHRGVGWKEIFKNLLKLRLPVLSAVNEYLAIEALTAAGIETMSVEAFGEAGLNPATRYSFIVTEELYNTVSLEDYCCHWQQQPPRYRDKRLLVEKLAQVSRAMHLAGINHRDYYICHFHLEVESLAEGHPRCYLIDLHRAQLRSVTPKRWLIKDLAGLYYSAMDAGLSRRDLLTFVKIYSDMPASKALKKNRKFWLAVAERARKLYIRDHGKQPPPMPFNF